MGFSRKLSLFPTLIGALVLLFSLHGMARAGTDIACHPALEPDKAQYVLGYGSLMETASRLRAWPNANTSVPVRVEGYAHGWKARGLDIGFSTTFLGVTPSAGAEMMAALFRVEDLKDFKTGDARESIYCRVPVPSERIHPLDNSAAPKDGTIWIYVLEAEHIRPPDEKFPIIQSYVDIFLSGCIELSNQSAAEDDDFLTQCIDMTSGWSSYWVNDRIYPRRPFYQPNAGRIDRLLKKMLPEQFSAIRIE